MFKQNRSRFEVRSQHLVADPHVWNIEHPIRRRGASLQHIHEFFTHKNYRHFSTNHTFFEDNHTYKVNHFTINPDSTNTKPPDYIANHPLNDANYPLSEHDCLTGRNDYHNCMTSGNDYHNCITSINDYQKRLDRQKIKGAGGLHACNCSACCQKQGSLMISVDDNCIIRDRNDHDCMIAQEDDDSFTFSTSAAESMEFFSEAGVDMMSCGLQGMSPADELFEGGKIRPLIAPIINGKDQPDSSSDYVTAAQHDQGLLIAIDKPATIHELICNSGIINQRLDEKGDDVDDDDQQQQQKLQLQVVDPAPCDHIASPFCKFVSLSAPASPTLILATNEIKHSERHEIDQIHSEISTNHTICINYFKRCRSLTRTFHTEDVKEKTLQEQAYGRRKGGAIENCKRTTLQDFLMQDETPTSLKPKQEQLELKSPPKNVFSSYEAQQRPSLAPAPINLPQLWPRQEQLHDDTNKKKQVRAPSPHGMHYAFQKAQAKRLNRKTFLPYHPRLLGCLGGYPLE